MTEFESLASLNETPELCKRLKRILSTIWRPTCDSKSGTTDLLVRVPTGKSLNGKSTRRNEDRSL